MKRFLVCFSLVLSQVAGAAPLFTQEYPVWVGDAVRTLKERGIVSAGTLPQQAINRNEMGQVLERYMRSQKSEQDGKFATREEVSELRTLIEQMLQEAERLNQRADGVEDLEERVDNVR
jgi:hypothetical protein